MPEGRCVSAACPATFHSVEKGDINVHEETIRALHDYIDPLMAEDIDVRSSGALNYPYLIEQHQADWPGNALRYVDALPERRLQ